MNADERKRDNEREKIFQKLDILKSPVKYSRYLREKSIKSIRLTRKRTRARNLSRYGVPYIPISLRRSRSPMDPEKRYQSRRKFGSPHHSKMIQHYMTRLEELGE
jgi:hypothetical protein